MSRAAYERVRAALEGTPLAGQIERLCAELHLTPESPEWMIAALTIIASSRLEQTLQRSDALADELPDRVEAVLRTQADPLAQRIAGAVGPAVVTALKEKIVENLSAQHDVALQAHDRARRAIENLEGELASHLNRIAAKSISALQQHGFWWPLAVLILAFALATQVWGGDRIAYGLGSSNKSSAVAHARKAGAYSQFLHDAQIYNRNPVEWRAEAERVR